MVACPRAAPPIVRQWRQRGHSLQGRPRPTLLLPLLPEQRKIAAILSSADDAIAATEAVIEQTRIVKQGLRQDLLTGAVRVTP